MGIGGGLVLLRPAIAAGASAAGGFEAIAVAVQAQDADVVGQPVEKRAGEPLRAQDRGPILEWQVRGHHSNDYSVPTAYGFRDVLVKGFVEEVVILCGGIEIARHERSYGTVFDPRV